MAKEALKSVKGSETVENNAESVSEKGQKAVQALKSAGKTECTVTEAKAIVEKFLKREVR